MTVAVQAITGSIKLFYPTIISTLAGYLLASPASLRFWIATQNVQAPPSDKNEASTRKTKLVGFGFITLLLAMEYLIIFEMSPQILDACLYAIYGVALFAGGMIMFTDITQSIRWSVHRNIFGVWSTAPIKQKRTRKQKAVLWSVCLASAFISVGAFATNNTVAIILASTAMVYNMSRNVGAPSLSMRGMVVGYLSVMALVLFLFSALFAWFIFKPRQESGSSESKNMDKTWIDVNPYIVAPLYSLFSGLLIALCLRFDYQKYLDTSDSPQEFILVTHPAPEPKEGKAPSIGDGVVLPSRAPTAFPKTYYTTALISWGLTQVAVLSIDAFTAISLKNAFQYSLTVLLLEFPVTLLALFGIAAVRGDLRALWTYREVWKVKHDVKGIAASDSTGLLSRGDVKLVFEDGNTSLI